MNAEAAMRLALSQARRGRGRTFPNPPVGAVVFRGDDVLGSGYTRPVGGPHAEVLALRNATRRAGERSLRGASMAVTLEPCSHRGRTGPCADLLVESGLRRVFVGHRDPHREVGGRGLRKLRRAGIAVEVDVLADECRRQHRGFLSVVERNRPFVILKLAGSLDGRIATREGESRWITGPEARAAVHRLRSRVDAIAVGSGTARADDPELTARRGVRVIHRPVRVVFDSRLQVAATSRLYRGEPGRAWVLCSRKALASRRMAIAATGAKVLDVPRSQRHLNLPRALETLAREGLTEILVEGGGELAAALIRASLVDEVHWFLAPKMLGAEGRPALGPLAVSRLARAPWLEGVAVRRVGKDIWIRGLLSGGAGAKGRK